MIYRTLRVFRFGASAECGLVARIERDSQRLSDLEQLIAGIKDGRLDKGPLSFNPYGLLRAKRDFGFAKEKIIFERGFIGELSDDERTRRPRVRFLVHAARGKWVMFESSLRDCNTCRM